MAPSTQTALIIPAEKADWKLVNDWPVPTPGPEEMLVKVIAAGLNPADWVIQVQGHPRIKAYPISGGLDGAGIVEEVGPDVTAFVKGDKVLFPGGFGDPRRSTFQQYTIVRVENAAKIPDNISFDQAASVCLCLDTAVVGLWAHHPDAQSVNFPAPWEEDGLTKFVGKAAFIVGGSSSVGQYAIQMAKLQGFSPILTTASPQHTAFLRSLGATHVIDRSLPSDAILTELPKLTGGAPIIYAIAAIADAERQHLAYDALAPGGALVVTLPFMAEVLADKVARDGGSKKVARPQASLHFPGNDVVGRELYRRLTGWLERGVVVPNRVEVIAGGLAGVINGCERLKKGTVSGIKLIVRPQETA